LEPFIVSARKYRPQTFKDVVGQQAITNTLLNAIENNHLAQALLFCGPRGVGKTTCARILAKQINQDGSQNENEDFAFNIFELDAASNNSVDDIRNLIDQVRIPPQVGKYKVYIIDEVHMLSANAFNAFLKTLEEPPKHAIFILATTEKHKIIPTILSRCQIFDFKRITVKDAANYLKYIAEQQGIEAEDDALHIIAQKADGAMRDALSIFDRVVSFTGKQLTRKAVTENLNVLDYEVYFEATDHILAHHIPNLLVQFNKILALGFEGHHFINGLASHFRDLMVCQHQETVALLEVGEATKKKYLEQVQKTSSAFLLQAIDIANDCDLKYKTSKNQRLLVELTLMKLASIDFDSEKKNLESVNQNTKASVSIAPASYYKNVEADKEVPSVESVPEIKEVIETPITPEKKVPAIEEKEIIPEVEAVSIPIADTPIVVKSAPLTNPLPKASETVTTTLVEETKSELQEKENTPVETKVVLATDKPILKVHEVANKYEVVTPITTPKINISLAEKRVSALSISSLKAKKAHEQNRKNESVDESQLPKDSFTEEVMQGHWADFVQKLDEAGRKILASNLNADIPKLRNETTLWIEMPNGTMKKEIEREQYDLMEYLKLKLNNHFINLQITVNEATAKKFAFTPEEKYQKLREKNPTIDLLRKEFDLDL